MSGPVCEFKLNLLAIIEGKFEFIQKYCNWASRDFLFEISQKITGLLNLDKKFEIIKFLF